MNVIKKNLGLLVLSAAVLAGVAAAFRYSSDMKAKAEAERDKALAEENAAVEKRKSDELLERKARAELKKAELNAEAQKASLQSVKFANEEAAKNKVAAEENRKAQEAAAAAAEKSLKAAEAGREAAKAKEAAAAAERDKAKAKENEAALRAREAADRLAAEKLKSEKIIAEAKMAELVKIDFQTWERDLLEFKQELDERARALKPEKTIADLSWVGGGEDKVFDEKGGITAKKKDEESRRPEDDPQLPAETRALAKEQRLVAEDESAQIVKIRTAVIKALEGLYVEALKDGRVVDAKYYKDNLRSFYPDWKFEGEKK